MYRSSYISMPNFKYLYDIQRIHEESSNMKVDQAIKKCNNSTGGFITGIEDVVENFTSPVG